MTFLQAYKYVLVQGQTPSRPPVNYSSACFSWWHLFQQQSHLRSTYWAPSWSYSGLEKCYSKHSLYAP